MLVEGVRQGRDHHLGGAADRLPVRRARTGRSTSRAAARAGAAFSWYTYSPTRVRYPYVRGVLLRDVPGGEGTAAATRCWRGPTIASDPERRRALPAGARQGRAGAGRAGTRRWRSSPPRTCTRSSEYGPDRVAGFSPIPAMSMVVARGRRPVPLADRRRRCCRSTTGTPTCRWPRRRCSATRPTCPSPATGGTPRYLIMWGSNVPVTRTPDAHWMAEARYRGQKVVVVSPDYADNVKFADEWLPRPARHRRRAGDGDGPRDPQGVLRRPDDAALRRLRQALHRPAVPGHAGASGDGGYLPGKFLTAADLGETGTRARVQDGAVGRRHRRAGGAERLARASGSPSPASAAGTSTSAAIDPLLTLYGATATSRVEVAPAPLRQRRRRRRCCAAACRPATVGGQLVTTVFDLLLAQYGVGRPGPAGHLADRLRRRRPSRTPRPGRSRSPACPPPRPTRIGREFADNAERVRRPVDDPDGRRARNHWFHSDTIYRALLALHHAHRLPGRQRRRLGALRRAGEVPAGHRLGARWRSAWTGRARRGR